MFCHNFAIVTNKEKIMSQLSGEGGWIYAAQEAESPLVKIGYSGYYPTRRLKELAYQFRTTFTLIAAVEVPWWTQKIELNVHRLLATERIEGEWFYLHITQASLETLVKHAEALVSEELYKAELYRQQHRKLRDKRPTHIPYAPLFFSLLDEEGIGEPPWYWIDRATIPVSH
jgi:hypothetical protein